MLLRNDYSTRKKSISTRLESRFPIVLLVFHYTFSLDLLFHCISSVRCQRLYRLTLSQGTRRHFSLHLTFRLLGLRAEGGAAAGRDDSSGPAVSLPA